MLYSPFYTAAPVEISTDMPYHSPQLLVVMVIVPPLPAHNGDGDHTSPYSTSSPQLLAAPPAAQASVTPHQPSLVP